MLKREDGIATIEVVIILAILVGLTLLFKTQVTNLVIRLLEEIVKEGVDKEKNDALVYYVFH